MRDGVALQHSGDILELVAGLADGDRVAKQQPRSGRAPALQIECSASRSEVPVDRCRAHPPNLMNRLRGRERVVEIPGLQEQRKPPREHHHEVLPARHPHQLPHVSQELKRRVPIRARPQPPPVDLLRRIREARPRQQPSRRRTRDPGGCLSLVKDSGLVGLGRLAIRVTKLVRDLPSRTQVNLAFHQASLRHQAGYALKVCEAPTPGTRSK
ncbi:unannotated protein [freshwater metagenome]|uniref:Unannotated protein n=1 Tax=freshwater metagenome TaxID=449393 RepID=A0A6J7LYQ5_9ZZZZ